MWQLTKLTATNICAFENLEYRPIQNQATLVFGNNMDNDSQNSNGSGKSALIEALAIGILGEPLRKVNVDEIINDRFNEATVSLSLFNTMTNTAMTINRRLSRKSPQSVEIGLETGNNGAMIVQASVADYNKYILEQVGLSKDDVLHNFILTARKYRSFLSCSDKDKKEIINRFSNGVMVDESIEALHEDMGPLQISLQEAESDVAMCNGRVSALAEEIERLTNNEEAHKASLQERIKSIQDSISNKRTEIRDLKKREIAANARIEELDALDMSMQELERSDSGITKAYEIINACFSKHGLPAISDYVSNIEESHKRCNDISEELKRLAQNAKVFADKIVALEENMLIVEASNKKEFVDIDNQSQKLENEIAELRNQVSKLRTQSRDLAQKRSTTNQAIATLEKQLAGVIECPKCHHEFVLSGNMNVEDARAKLASRQVELKDIEADIEEADIKYDKCVCEGKAKSNEQAELNTKKQSLEQAYNDIKMKLANAKSEHCTINSDFAAAQRRLSDIQSSVFCMQKKMFDEVFDIIDTTIKSIDRDLDDIDRRIQTAQSAIEAYEGQIKQLQSSSQSNELKHLKESVAKHQEELKKAEANKESISLKLNTLKAQEATFVEFKTYLANAKINAISQITNDFLEAIGSDIRVTLSGYTILKSGKVRDKISVSLIRDGVDCGSFDKFSAGEKCRVELASVLALHKLSNVNCEEGKGLNLLVIDEILDCTDETGLANVFKTLNEAQVTALVVSHGNVAENYPNRLVVTKQNGISTINEITKQ